MGSGFVLSKNYSPALYLLRILLLDDNSLLGIYGFM